MKRIQILATIFLVAIIGSALAQENYDLSARMVEPARARFVPYHRMADAVAGNAVLSRFVAAVEKPTRSEGGSVATFTTHFALPVSWLNRQVILRVGYASAAYTVYVNGREAGFAPTGVMGAEFNITKLAKEGRNEVSITLDKTLLANKLYEPKTMTVENIEVFSQSPFSIILLSCISYVVAIITRKNYLVNNNSYYYLIFFKIFSPQ